MAASLGLFDGTGFDREAVRRAGLPERLLPEVSEEAELGGGRLRVFAALGDNQASFLGAGHGRLDAPLVNIGTGSQFSSRKNASPCRGWKRGRFPAAGC